MSLIRFAILGTAKIARTVAPKIQSSTGARLDGVASRSAEKAENFALEFGIPKSYSSYQEAVDDPEIDAVYIPLPPSMHLEWTSRAAEAGKHVLCEKPLACDVAEVDQMIDVCQKHDVVLLDGVMWYHTPRATKIREAVASGFLGDLRQLTSVFTFQWDTFPMENLRMHRGMGGGSLLDLGWYCVGSALLLFEEMPHSVFAKATWHNDVDTRMNGLLWFADNKVATIESGFDAVRRRWFEMAGSKQTLICDDFTRPWNDDNPAFRTVDSDGKRTEFAVPHKPQEECMVEAFCDLIRQRQTSHRLLTLSRQTQAVCDALDKSARAGQIVEIS